jgi:hypothetical protein
MAFVVPHPPRGEEPIARTAAGAPAPARLSALGWSSPLYGPHGPGRVDLRTGRRLTVRVEDTVMHLLDGPALLRHQGHET